MKVKGVTQTEAIKKTKTINSQFFIAKNYMLNKSSKKVVNVKESAYQIVTTYLKKHPTSTVANALAKTKANSGAYYTQRKKINSGGKVSKKSKKVIPQVIDVPVENKPAKAVVIVCDPNDLRDVISNLF